jgi:hypothetical protein
MFSILNEVKTVSCLENALLLVKRGSFDTKGNKQTFVDFKSALEAQGQGKPYPQHHIV